MQVLRFPGSVDQPTRNLFGNYHGELFIICLEGGCRVVTQSSSLTLADHDQVLLVDGEPFRIDGITEGDAVVELIWAPGPNPCRVCWENDGRFFGEGTGG